MLKKKKRWKERKVRRTLIRITKKITQEATSDTAKDENSGVAKMRIKENGQHDQISRRRRIILGCEESVRLRRIEEKYWDQ